MKQRLRKLLSILMLCGLLAGIVPPLPASAATVDGEPYIGQICLFPYEFVPWGWAECKGQTLSVMQNQGLFSLIGAYYGGNGSTTFALPKLVAPLANTKYCIALQGIYPLRGGDPSMETDLNLGEVVLFPYTFVPDGFYLCDGTTKPIATTPNLFAVLGTTFGGDGISTFAVPNLQKTVSDPMLKYCMVSNGQFPTDGRLDKHGFIGEIILGPYQNPDMNHVLCTGQQGYPVAPYQGLSALLKARFGGDGVTTFGLPDLRGAAPIPGLRYSIMLQGVNPTKD